MNAGAALVVVVATAIAGSAPVGAGLPWLAAVGAVGVFAVVIGLASAGRSGPTPVKVTLAGVAMAAFASAITAAILIFDEQTLQEIRLWLAGNLAGRSLEGLGYAAPSMILGGLIALGMSLRLNAMALGELSAKSLGVNVLRARIACLVAVALLTGAAVAAAGPIGFVGLVVPHIVKLFVPNDNRAILPLSAAVGAVALVLADVIARVALAPQEIATGLVTALVGAPIFVILVRSRL
jgi:iron complex transport system permease protein